MTEKSDKQEKLWYEDEAFQKHIRDSVKSQPRDNSVKEVTGMGDDIGGVVPMTLEELLNKEFPQNLWLVEGLIPNHGITVLSASPGSFKTWLLLDIAQSVASGKSLFDEFKTAQTGVLVVDEENGEMLLQLRLRLLGADKELPIHFMVSKEYRLTDRLIEDVIDYCDIENIGFVTFDSLVRIHDGNENDAGEMATVFKGVKRITNAGITVLLTHHNRKPSGTAKGLGHEMRGSSDILAAIDCHLALLKDDEDERHLILKQTKVRLTEELPAIELLVSSNDKAIKFIYEGNKAPSKSKQEATLEFVQQVLEANGKLNQSDIRVKLIELGHKVNMRTLRFTLEKLEGEKVIQKEQGSRNALVYSLIQSED